MARQLLENDIHPADDEKLVVSYFCSYYRSRLLGLEASGHLGVTNKRVLFFAQGSSSAGPSIIQSEVPLADVSGIASYKGTYFSLLHLILGFFVSTIFAGIVSSILVAVASSSFGDGPVILAWIAAIGGIVASFSFSNSSILRPMLATAGAMIFGLLAGFALAVDMFRYFFAPPDLRLEFLLAAGVAIYSLLCLFWYARRPTFSLQIGSKAGGNTPISISGIGRMNSSAARALNAEPAQDTEIMLKQLGAVVMDIQLLGEHGVKKWQQGEAK